MGEVRVSIKLVNVADLAAVAAASLDPSAVRMIEADALVDTGAVRSCVPRPLLDRLGLRPTGHTMVEYANGQKEAVAVAYGVMFEILHRQTSARGASNTATCVTTWCCQKMSTQGFKRLRRNLRRSTD